MGEAQVPSHRQRDYACGVPHGRLTGMHSDHSAARPAGSWTQPCLSLGSRLEMLGKWQADEGRFRVGVGISENDFADPRRGHIRGLIVLAHLAQAAVSYGLPKRLEVLAAHGRAPCGEAENQFTPSVTVNRRKKREGRESLDAVPSAESGAEGWMDAFLVTRGVLLNGGCFFVGGFDHGLQVQGCTVGVLRLLPASRESFGAPHECDVLAPAPDDLPRLFQTLLHPLPCRCHRSRDRVADKSRPGFDAADYGRCDR